MSSTADRTVCSLRGPRRSDRLRWSCLGGLLFLFTNVAAAQQVWPVWSDLKLSPLQVELLRAYEHQVQQLEIPAALGIAKVLTPAQFPAGQGDAAAVAAFAQAQAEYLKGDLFLSEQRFQEIHEARQTPRYLQDVARLAQADLLFARQQFLAAKKLLEAVAKDAPLDVQATSHVLAAEIAISEERFADADNALKKAEQVLPAARLRRPALASRIGLARARLASERFRFADARKFIQGTPLDTPWDKLAGQLALASARWKVDDNAAASKEFSASLETLQRSFGENHFRTVTVKSSVALLKSDLGNAIEGQAAMEIVLKQWQAIFGDRLSEFPTYWFQLASLQYTRTFMGQREDMPATMRQALEAVRAAQGEQSPQYVKGLSHLGMLTAVGPFGSKSDDGLKLIEQGLSHAVGPLRDAPCRANALRNRARVVLRSKADFARAEADLIAARDVLTSAYCDAKQPDSFGLVSVLEELFDLYEKAKQAPQAARIAAQIERCKALQPTPQESSEDLERTVAGINKLAKDPAKLPDAVKKARELMQRLTEEADQVPLNLTALSEHTLKMAALSSLDAPIRKQFLDDAVHEKFLAKLQELGERSTKLDNPAKSKSSPQKKN